MEPPNFQFLATAKASAAEVRCQLYVAIDQGYIPEAEFLKLDQLASETGKMVGGLMIYLRNSGFRGTKFKPALQK